VGLQKVVSKRWAQVEKGEALQRTDWSVAKCTHKTAPECLAYQHQKNTFCNELTHGVTKPLKQNTLQQASKAFTCKNVIHKR